jgi:hypothetical protein
MGSPRGEVKVEVWCGQPSHLPENFYEHSNSWNDSRGTGRPQVRKYASKNGKVYPGSQQQPDTALCASRPFRCWRFAHLSQ